jgi:curved DNA-binding protein CbpA
MTDSILSHYRMLNLKPTATWTQARAAYRQQVAAAHPDRFHNNLTEHQYAEEKTKQLNLAYEALSEHYRLHGRLPLEPHETVAPPAEPNADDSGQHQASASPTATTPVGEPARMRPRRSVSMLVLVTAVLIGYLWLVDMDNDHRNDGGLPPPGDEPRPGLGESAPTEDKLPRAPFTAGATVGEVIAAQGVPTRRENNTWVYGTSKIYFENGRVSRWEEDSATPLNVSGESTTLQQHTRLINLGSTKEEVRAIHGPPWRESVDAWEYGGSKIYFKNNRVTGWEESAHHPLRVRK